MLKQSIRTEIDFKAEEWRWKLSTNEEWLRIKEEGEVKWCEQQGNNNNHRKMKEIQTRVNVEMEGIVGRLSKKNRLIISGKDMTRESNQIDQINDAEQLIVCN